MADVTIDKKLKLANTRKRFKELQELKNKRNERVNQHNVCQTSDVNSAESSNRNTPVYEEKDIKNNLGDNQQNNGDEESLSFNKECIPVDSRIANPTNNLLNTSNLEGNNVGGGEHLFTNETTNLTQEHVSTNVPRNITETQGNSSINASNATTEILGTNLPNYFNHANNEVPAEFFDNIVPADAPDKPHESESPSLLTYFNTSEGMLQNTTTENIGLPKYFDNINSSSTIWENTVPESREVFLGDYTLFPDREETDYKDLNQPGTSTEDALSLDDPEIRQNEISEYAKKRPQNLITNVPNAETNQYMEKNLEAIFSPSDTQKLMDYLGTTGVTEAEKNLILETRDEINNTTDLAKQEILHSNSESLRQLSNQLAHLIEPNYEYSSAGSITDLEKRNIELAANLEKERLNSNHLRATNSELQSRITQLEADFIQRELGSNLHNAQEIAHLKNELQTHLQTIGLLVAEKTELSSNLSQYELNSKQKVAECEELQARLKASRSRVADLERELNNLRSEKNKTESLEEQYAATLENLKQEYRLVKEQKNEMSQDLLEVREKLKNTLDENVKLQEEIKDLSGKVSLADIKIQQLSSGGPLEVGTQVEQLAQEKFSLERDIANLNQMLKSIIRERDDSTVQYQQYAQQLNAQISNLSSKLEQIQQEKENLLIQEQNRIKHIGELERQLQSIQNDQITYITRNSNGTELKTELENVREMCVQLQIEKTAIEENYTKVSNEKDLLLKELEAKTDSISQLESMIEQLRGNQPDSVKLLATMESDKVAASRAIQQNRELKQQLESMQEVFMKLDNDKVELTENLKGQQQTNKELIEKLQKTELTLQSLADAIEIKDKELMHLRESFDEMNRQALHHEQLEDRLRHYEAHGNSAHIIQHELQEAKQTIMKLSNELNKKKEEETKYVAVNKDVLKSELEEAKRKIVELTNELNKSKIMSEVQHLSEYAEPQETLSHLKELMNGEENKKIESHVDGNKNVLDKENAMKYLEEKVKRTMQEIADLSDEKQRLEHIVFQLQCETETIGEYVALYQHQRMVLKQKALEKDQQLKQLSNDREQIKVKLDRLNQLIKKLVTEKGTVPPELIQHQESMTNQFNNFCEEHSKINDEIKRISKNQSNIIEPESEKENDETSQTAEEIITLLSEIKTSNLVQPDENFHHCPWCSGQLITV